MLCVCNTCTLHRLQPVEDPRYTIPGEPIPWARAMPAFTKRIMYDSQKDAKLAIGSLVRYQHSNEPLYRGPLHLDAMFYLPYATSKQLRKKQQEQKYVDTKPDWDNCGKMLSDACNTILYDDDKRIASCYVAKVYDDKPRTEFNIIQLKDM